MAERMRGEENFLEVPVLRTVHRRQAVSVFGTIGHALNCICSFPNVLEKVCAVAEKFRPDIVVVDREFFLPWIAKLKKWPLISIDHSHVLKACEYEVPWGQKVSWGLAMVNDYLLYDVSRHNLIVSFFHPGLKRTQRKGELNLLLPPVLRDEVRAFSPRRGDYVFVYQSSATFSRLLEPLKKLDREVVIYGMSHCEKQEGNLIFRGFSERRLLEDLSGASYAVVNGGHNVICEALYYEKPILCFPIRGLFEQFLNAWYVRALGYGDYSLDLSPSLDLFRRFEISLDKYREKIQRGFEDGTERVCQALEAAIALYAEKS